MTTITKIDSDFFGDFFPGYRKLYDVSVLGTLAIRDLHHINDLTRYLFLIFVWCCRERHLLADVFLFIFTFICNLHVEGMDAGGTGAGINTGSIGEVNFFNL